MPQMQYLLQHQAAMINPQGFEVIVLVYNAWNEYANTYNRRYESFIGDDYVLGPAWAKIGQGLLGLLNGELGRLDGGLMDGGIRATLRAHHINPDTYEPTEQEEDHDEQPADDQTA